VQILFLDEAARSADMASSRHQRIIMLLPPQRQRCFSSATFSETSKPPHNSRR